jgi:hypothetical protein
VRLNRASLLALVFLVASASGQTNSTQAPASTLAPASAAPVSTLPDAPQPAPPITAALPAQTSQPKPTNWFQRFLNGPEVKPLTRYEKARLAVRNVIDPFNLLTVAGDSAISVASDSDSVYGPGMHGFGRNLGVSFTQDLNGEFFSTFLIPSITHQDPHYHRMPKASIPRRILHATVQIAWTQGDNGKGMVNYADIVGAGIQDEINNLYVPGRDTRPAASASRYAIGLATAPIDNYVSEFLPDLARHVHVQIVVIQRIINQVAKTDTPSSP